jgi:ribonuclease J
MTHSIPEPNALAIRTKLGTVFHTGDWKIDPEPLLGEVTDEATLQRIGEQGALAMVCDSTNVFVEGEAGSEATIRVNLEKLVKTRRLPRRGDLLCLQPGAGREHRQGGGRGRAASGAVGPRAAAHGRGGAGMRLPARSSRRPIAEQEAGYLPRDKVLFICTGSQGEPRASMAKLATGEHRDLVLERATRRSSPRA